jgi:hypothetical protein
VAEASNHEYFELNLLLFEPAGVVRVLVFTVFTWSVTFSKDALPPSSWFLMLQNQPDPNVFILRMKQHVTPERHNKPVVLNSVSVRKAISC